MIPLINLSQILVVIDQNSGEMKEGKLGNETEFSDINDLYNSSQIYCSHLEKQVKLCILHTKTNPGLSHFSSAKLYELD